MGFFPHYCAGLHPLAMLFSALRQGLIVVLISTFVDRETV